MKCPIDQTTLTIADRQGIEIDYCPTCRGVWLDRGELDKLVERASGFDQPRRGEERNEHQDRDDHREHDRPQYSDDRRHYDNDSYSHGSSHHGKPHKKESFLGDLFDF